ncbi:MAG: leucyl/phenylalanyl-tRNA--protein transferase [Deltaproteobacteria bacterium]|nr:leucyl/phenylalanyl-tRNA--protein transferase [Deltaproteobacteria bacterium]
MSTNSITQARVDRRSSGGRWAFSPLGNCRRALFSARRLPRSGAALSLLVVERPSADPEHGFGDPLAADADGVVALGGPMDPARLLAAYARGIFPWSGDPVRWCSPDPRAIFYRIRLPRKLGKMMRRGDFRVTFDQDFDAVISGCAESHRDDGEWITDAFVEAYSELHRHGYAHSVEVWQAGRLVGGLYGVQLNGLFAGESMFTRVDNASKVGFAHLVWHLATIGTVLFDCQMLTPLTHALGAVYVHRSDYLYLLDEAMEVQTAFSGERWPAAGAPGVAERSAATRQRKSTKTSGNGEADR